MKRKILAVIAMVCIAAFALTACGGGGDKSPAPAGSGGAAPAAGGETAQAETYDVGAFTVAIPSGWTAFPQTDMWGEADADGKQPIDPEQIMIAKGATDEFSAYNGPLVRIYYHGPDSVIMDSRDFYDDVQELEGVTINGTACDAFSGNSMGYIYQFLKYETDSASYEINILTNADGKDTGITWEDPEVQTILNSIATK